jgi:hypothetical protein
LYDLSRRPRPLHNLFTQPLATILLTVSYPESYPDTAPGLDISLPPNALPVPHVSLTTDRLNLLASLDSIIEENLGMAMIFTLVSALKETIEQLILERQDAVQAVKDQEARKAEEVENAKFHGEAVTRESFLKWREKFRAEMEEVRVVEEKEREVETGKRRAVKDEKRLTGKELWERGMVGKIEEEGEAEEVDALEKLKVTE